MDEIPFVEIGGQGAVTFAYARRRTTPDQVSVRGLSILLSGRLGRSTVTRRTQMVAATEWMRRAPHSDTQAEPWIIDAASKAVKVLEDRAPIF